jgi:hypothetical protein
MTDPVSRYPGYDVLRKRNTVSWNDQTRTVVDRRLAVDRTPHALTADEFATLDAICGCIVPQDGGEGFVPVAAYVDQGLTLGLDPGYRNAKMPPATEAWKRAIRALDAEARRAFDKPFVALEATRRDALLTRMQKGELKDPAWGDMAPDMFFKQHVLTDIVAAFYAHPTAWSRIGYGGPASPRGYVRMGFGMRDPWEAAEAKPGEAHKAAKANRNV